MKTTLLAALCIISSVGTPANADTNRIFLTEIARFEQGIFDKSAAEIISYDKSSKQFYLVNGAAPSVDILALEGNTLTKTGTMPLAPSEAPTSVAVYKGLIAVAVHAVTATNRPGKIILFNTSGDRLAELPAGDLPDMVTFTEDGRYLLVANEGEPLGKADPEGSITVISLNQAHLTQSEIRTIYFKDQGTEALRRKGVRIFPGKMAATDLEPEYIATSGTKAFVSLQENNAIAVIDIPSAQLLTIFPLGYKDHSLAGSGLDTDDKDKNAQIQPRPLRGLYMPDSIATYKTADQTYILTANEGDSRTEDVRIEKAKLDKSLRKALLKSHVGDRLKISSIDGDTDGDGDIDIAYSYGARSFSIWSEQGDLVFDSGDQFAQIVLSELGYDAFNNHNDENKADSRSDDKGVEPEGIAVGKIGDRTYAFIGLERTGGVMVYDITDPLSATYVSYFNDRNFDPQLDPTLGKEPLAKIGHLGPEGVTFISAEDSPYGKPTLAVAYEVSGSVGLYVIENK